MGALILSFRVAAFTLILLTAFQLIRGSQNRRFNISYLVLASCMAVYLFTPYFFLWPGAEFSLPVPLALGVLIDAIASATPAVFAVFTVIVFQDRLPPFGMIIAAFAMMILDMIGFSCEAGVCGPFTPLADQTWALFLAGPFPHLLRVGFIALSIAWTLDGWTTDLVETRRRFRAVFLAVQGLLIVTVVVLENFIPSSLVAPETSLLFNSVLICFSAGLLAAFFLQTNTDVAEQLTQPIQVTNPKERLLSGLISTDELPETDAVMPESADIKALRALFDEQQVYHQTDLTIGSLASMMNLPEYKLRTLVNKELGFRNFNELLNQYRITEAAARLIEPSAKPLPILTIALDVGYRSLSTFNKAFKERHGLTPSEYRKQQSR
jgi:AraC-like DNA-binding protein